MVAKPQLYDRIGVGYQRAREADPAIFAQVIDALGDASTILNIGAGTGNYEPKDRFVVAVEPNSVMIEQRTLDAPVVQAFAEALPVVDQSFDAALAMFTIHHWPDRVTGLKEMGRVAKRQVALVYDWQASADFWLGDYFPSLRQAGPGEHPSAKWMGEHLRLREERIMWVPANCTDGFAGCYWNRPERYLDPRVQAGMSILARLPEPVRSDGSAALAAELESGAWHDKYGHLLELNRFDMGYRLAICEW